MIVRPHYLEMLKTFPTPHELKMVSKEGTTVAEKKNAALEKRIGVFQEIDQPEKASPPRR